MNQLLDTSDAHGHIEDILKNLLLLSKHLSLYSEHNAVVQTATDRLLASLETARKNQLPVYFTVAKNNFLVFDEPLDTRNKTLGRYAYRMFQHGITSVSLTPELTISSLYAFLRILIGSPAETWKNGGIISQLEHYGTTGIILTQMSKDDFLLVNGKQPDTRRFAGITGVEEFWERFARSLLAAVVEVDDHEPVESFRDPVALAEQISLILTEKSGAEQIDFNKALMRCIATIRIHQPKSEQLEILVKLAELINHLDDVPGRKVMRELCTLQIPAGFAKDLFERFSNKHILSAFHDVVSGNNYASPMMVSLLKTLADSRAISPDNPVNLDSDFSLKSRNILSNDRIVEFVPPRYQQALLNVLADHQQPQSLTTELKKLKESLEDFHIEAQVAQLSIFMLQQGPDKEQIQALHRQLVRSMQFFVEGNNYVDLLTLCRSCFNSDTGIETEQLANMMPQSLLKQILKDASHLEKDYKLLVGEIIDLIGTPFIKPLLELTVAEKNRSNRFFYLNCLKKLGRDVVTEATAYLNNNQWFVTRNMLLLLGELESKEQLPSIRPLLHHSHSKVRQEALKTCLLLGDPQSIKQLMTSFSSTDRQEILNAIVMSKLVNNQEISNELISMLERKTLFALDLEMKKALVQTLAENATPEALRVFRKILNSRHLFKQQAYEQLKIDVIKALAKYPPEQANPLLQQQLNKGSAEAVSLIRKILSRNNQEGSP